MLLATFNVNSIRSRLPIVLDWLKKHQPDFLCLQETKVQDDEFPAEAFLEKDFKPIFKGEKSYNGVAIITRQIPDEVSYGFDDEGPSDAARLIYARFKNLHLVNTYIPQGRALDHPMFQYKLEWLARLRRFFDSRFKPDDLVAWVGDFNVAPEALDIHNAERQADHVCFHVSVREAFAEVVKWGFVDVLRQHHPGVAGVYSYYEYRVRGAVERNMGWRVDHVMATEALAEKSVKCEVDLEPRRQERPSDHTVVMAEFEGLPN